MNIPSTKFASSRALPKNLSALPRTDAQAKAPSDSFTFSDSRSGGKVLKAVATLAGAGAGIYAASLITGFEPGVGGVANGLVGAVGMGYFGMHGTYALTGKDNAEDRIAGAVLSLMGGAAGFATGAVLGGMGYNSSLLAVAALGGIGGVVGHGIASNFY